MSFIKKEDRENIEKLNKALGTKHRSKPYDLNNSDDIIAATIIATAEYADMFNYWSVLNNINEALDESLEYLRPEGWINLGLKGTTGDEEMDAAINSLNKTIDYFSVLMEKSEQRCIEMWKNVMLRPKEAVHKHFFGEVVMYNNEMAEKVLEESIFEILSSMEYDGVMENSAENFAKELKKYLADK